MSSKVNFSRKRQAILDVIRSTKSHPSAEWVYEQLKPTFHDLSLATVYRNIAGFKRRNLVRHIAVVDGQERIDANTADHVHFICEVCGRVIDVDDCIFTVGFPADAPSTVGCSPDDVRSVLREKYGFTVSSQGMILYGNCRDCQHF